MHTSTRRHSSSSSHSSHPAIPDSGTWSIRSVIQPTPSSSDDLLSDAQLDKLHRLSALIPPSSAEEREKLKRELCVMLRLVRGVLPSHDGTKVESRQVGEMVDARPLSAHDKNWSVTLNTLQPELEASKVEEDHKEGTAVLDRDTLLGKVDGSRKYHEYFVVDRT